MRNMLRKIHLLPEEVRKLLAGLCMLAAGIAFFGVWTSFVSSRLVALAPAPGAGVAQGGQPDTMAFAGGAQSAPVPSASEALSPAEGIAQTLRGFGNAVSDSALSSRQPSAQTAGAPQVQGFFAILARQAQTLIVNAGAAVQRAIEYAYRAVARYVPPNL